VKLTIVPHNTGEVRQIRISPILLGLGGLVLILAFVEKYLLSGTISDPRKIAESNRYLESELKVCEEEYEKLASRMQAFLDIAKRYQSVKYDTLKLPKNTQYNSIDELFVELQKYKLLLNKVSNTLNQFPEIVKAVPSILPVDGYIIQSYGKSNYIFTGEERECRGVDFIALLGSKVYATAYGKVKYTGRRLHEGLVVEIEHKYGFLTKYSHLSFIKVKTGEYVRRGEVIGLVGTTGKTIGPQLHYEVWHNGSPQNPLDFVLCGVKYF
jgi:murein DD-endopeptidase MepM/ murein hydrolase activator NlpD